MVKEPLSEVSGRAHNNGRYLLDWPWLEARLSSRLNGLPHPFLRWAGSKRWLLRHLAPLMPRQFGTYHEPFLGSGAFFFLLCPSRASLGDKCGDLIDAYARVRDGVSAIIRYLRPLKPDRDLFYAIRNVPSRGKLKRAAEFIYLNKTCWNGLYRVNSEGRFNVPYGMPTTEFIADFENLRACSQALQKPGVTLKSCDFEETLKDVKPRDFVYLDPPYVTCHSKNGFIEYNETLFSWEDQKRLAKRALKLAGAGAYVIVTNADNHKVVELYRGFRMQTVARSSTLASDPNFRIRVKEAILYSPNCHG